MKCDVTRAEWKALARDRIVLAVAGVVLFLLFGLTWVLFGGVLWGDGKSSAYTHMHCPVCRNEVVYNAKLAGQQCMNCENDAGKYTPTVGSIADGVRVGIGARVVVGLLLTAFLVECLAYVSARRLRALRRAAEEYRTRTVVCACPFCQRKVGYPATKADAGLVCSRCKTAFRLPPPLAAGELEKRHAKAR